MNVIWSIQFVGMVFKWIGVIAIGRTGKRIEWWWLLFSCLLDTVLLSHDFLKLTWGWSIPILSSLTHTLPNGSRFSVYGILMFAGSISFAIAFALYALRSSHLFTKSAARVTELELMNLAQATELERLRNR